MQTYCDIMVACVQQAYNELYNNLLVIGCLSGMKAWMSIGE